MNKIRFYDDQLAKANAFNDWIILAGQDAHKAYYRWNSTMSRSEAGKGERWALIRDSFKLGNDVIPCLLDSKDLSQLDRLLLAPTAQRFIKIFQVGELPTLAKDKDDFRTRVLMNLAEHCPNLTAVEWLDEGFNTENLTSEYQRIKNGQHATAELLEQRTLNPEDDTAPRVEMRKRGGLKGLYYITTRIVDGEKVESEKWLSDFVEVIGLGKGESEHFIILQKEKQERPLVMPLKDIGERDGWQYLKRNDVTVTTKQALRAELADYLQFKSRTAKQYYITDKTGWNDDLTAFTLPNGETLGQPQTPTIFRNLTQNIEGYRVSGTTADWVENIGRYCVGNPSMMLSVGVALSAPLLKPLEADGYGVHLYEDSTFGKTTALNIAASIYGHPRETRTAWNATPLALQNEAFSRNGLFMPLDEISEASPKAVAQTAYSLFNGQGKLQGAKEGGNRKSIKWLVANLSTGEEGLESYLKQQGIKVNAGQLVRLLNIPMKRATEFHGLADGKTHADTLNTNVMKFYGAVGVDWLTYLVQAEKSALRALYDKVKQSRLKSLPDNSEPQIKRVMADRFALIETALLLAKDILQWTEQDISNAITANFNEWVNAYGWHSKKHTQIIEQVNGWLLVNADTRFEEFPPDGTQKPISNKAGYRLVEDDRYFVFKSVFEDEALQGQTKEVALPVLVKAGILHKGEGNGYAYLQRMPRKINPKRTRAYLVEILNEDSEV